MHNSSFALAPKGSIKNILNKLPNDKSRAVFLEGFYNYQKLASDHEKAFGYLKNLANKNHINSEQEWKNYQSLFENNWKKPNDSTNHFNQFISQNDNFSLNDYLDKLTKFYTVSSSMAGVAGAVAAGYYLEAAFDFGTTIASGAAATAQSIGLGVQAGTIKGEISTILANAQKINIDKTLTFDKYNKWMNKHRFDIKNIIQFIDNLLQSVQTIEKVMTIVMTLVDSTAWTAPEGMVVEDIANIILDTALNTVLSAISSQADAITSKTDHSDIK